MQGLALLFRYIHNGNEQWGPDDLPIFAACMATAAMPITGQAQDLGMWAEVAQVELYVSHTGGFHVKCS